MPSAHSLTSETFVCRQTKEWDWEETVHFQEDVYVHRKYSPTYIPTQVRWSLPSWKPVRESHVHWKEPAILTQLPRGSQPSLPITHSLMSEGKKRKKHSDFLSLRLISNPTVIYVFSSLPLSFPPSFLLSFHTREIPIQLAPFPLS